MKQPKKITYHKSSTLNDLKVMPLHFCKGNLIECKYCQAIEDVRKMLKKEAEKAEKIAKKEFKEGDLAFTEMVVIKEFIERIANLEEK